jgi:hypothetical protein
MRPPTRKRRPGQGAAAQVLAYPETGSCIANVAHAQALRRDRLSPPIPPREPHKLYIERLAFAFLKRHYADAIAHGDDVGTRRTSAKMQELLNGGAS